MQGVVENFTCVCVCACKFFFFAMKVQGELKVTFISHGGSEVLCNGGEWHGEAVTMSREMC